MFIELTKTSPHARRPSATVYGGVRLMHQRATSSPDRWEVPV